MPGRRVVVFALSLLLVGPRHAHAQVDREDWRPPALEASPTCDVYTGTSDGNDPSKLVEMRICTNGANVTGQAQYSGKASGWNRRDFAGAWSADGTSLELHETAIVEQKPAPGWRFCLVDRYAFTKDPATNTLTGTYDSAACRDHSQLSLTRSGAIARADVPSTTPIAPPPPASSVDIPPPRRGCGCSAVGADIQGGWIAISACCAAMAIRSRRARRDRRA